MKLVPSISIRSRIISSTIEGFLKNHQHPKAIRLLNFRAYRARAGSPSSRTLTRKRFSGKSRQIFSTARMSALPAASPARRIRGFTWRRTPIMSESGISNSRHEGRTASLRSFP